MSNPHSPIADLEHRFAISIINNVVAETIAKDIAKRCSKSAIGECGLRIFGQHPVLPVIGAWRNYLDLPSPRVL